MKLRGAAYLVTLALYLLPIVRPGGGTYLRFVGASPTVVVPVFALTLLVAIYLLRRLLELAFRIPGASLGPHQKQGGAR